MAHCRTCTCDDLSDPAADTVGGFRKDNPSTSVAAAYDVLPRTGTQRMRVLEHLIECGADGATDDETMTALSMEPSSAQTRRNELTKGGWVYDTGLLRPTHTGQDAIVWGVTPEGRRRYYEQSGLTPPTEEVVVASTGRIVKRSARRVPAPRHQAAPEKELRRHAPKVRRRGAQSSQAAEPARQRRVLTQEEKEARAEQLRRQDEERIRATTGR